MLRPTLVFLALLNTGSVIFAVGVRDAAAGLTRMLNDTICLQVRSEDKNCTVTLESSTHNLLPENNALWAFTWSAKTAFKRKGERGDAMRDALEKKRVYVLDIFADHFTGIAYFREQPGGIVQVGGNEFAMITMNPVYKAVARIMPELLRAGDVRYELPAAWQSEGVKASDEDELRLEFTAPESPLTVRLADLDDADLAGVSIAACLIDSTTGKAQPCDAAKIAPAPLTAATVKLKLKAARKIKTSQPAFKLLLQNAQGTKTLMQLAIAFKPGPNYFMFAVTGFLFGGLMAVMMLVMKRKNTAQPKPDTTQ